ncbi:hypothetical protein [Herminiimonas fonticola]|uniref:Uncharacterized protein n=1 Tax=Herminiimonas fonticola TaxID=303380 RepID=A0A4R6G4Q0_9BURK|nr:hypothetical protein [Herminiimonas fonticola]RBA23109.1 hypothetical protein Hfont_2912 [Herminiimonas fonticola]TDN89449.1 hypothetical protein EV677_1506 [Herminiimonas fonticola]
MSQDQTFQILHDSLNAVRENKLGITEFCQLWRSQSALLSSLPSRYNEVMEDLLSRLEAGSLFTEESCSFSQIDLLATLDVWLETARQSQ